ncbi:MAG: hypothetical protein B655_0058 [Methanobacterium sp. Maddingley MBC34]|nr:MAG: hypothetical protein B655_0058 [Methanobacterium sp. Maddingley MBC34]
METGENILLDDNYPCYTADITPDGRWALTSNRETLTLWDLDERNSIKNIRSKDSFKIIIRSDGQMAIVIFDSYLKVYDLSTWEVVKEISGQDELYSFSISADFKTAVWISDGNLIVYDFENDKIVKIIRGRGLMATPTTTISPDGSKFLCFTHHRMNYLWDIEKVDFMDRIGNNITDLTPDFKLAITGDTNPGDLLDITRLKRVGMFVNEAKTIKTLNEGAEHLLKDSKITADGRRGVSLDGRSNICIWDLERGESLKDLKREGRKIIP